MNHQSPYPGPSRFLLLLALLLLFGAGGFIAVNWVTSEQKPDARKAAADMTKALDANNRGVGWMLRFQYPPAVAAFEDVVKFAPDWPTGRINLGIGLLNLARGQNSSDERDATLRRAIGLFKDVLVQEPDNPHAHFCLGLIYQDALNQFDEARTHFERVTQIDPHDAATWYWLGTTYQDDPDRALECFQRAVALDPSLSAGLHQLAEKLRHAGKDQEANDVQGRLEALRRGNWLNSIDPRFNTDLGKYALVIGRPVDQPAAATGPPLPFEERRGFGVKLRPGARWATAADFGKDTVGELRRRLRSRFGATMVVLDYNRDNRPDLFLVGAVVENGKVGDLLLRNDGENQFTDVTTEAGLGGARPGIGCCVADFDNDGFPDLLITGIGEVRLFRNTGKLTFEDVTNKAGLGGKLGVCLGSAFVDLDQDGDLDLLVAQYADTPEKALAVLKGEQAPSGGGLVVFLNVGEAVAAGPQVDPPPLTAAFRRLDKPAGLLGEPAPLVALAASDLDQDYDLDLLALADGQVPTMVLNDRLLQFHRLGLSADQAPAAQWNGALVLDANKDGRSDLFLIGPEQRPILLLRRPSWPEEKDAAKWFEVGAVDSPPLIQAQAIDLDLDGWTDVVGLSRSGKPVFLQNDGRGLVHRPGAFGAAEQGPDDLIAFVCTDVNGDGYPDLLLWSEGQGLLVHTAKYQGNDNRGLKLWLTGHRRKADHGNKPVRTNADGFGTWVSAHAGGFYTGAEYTTLSAGLGQSHQPLVLGLGRNNEADLVRLRWPDIVWQGEFNVSTVWPGDLNFEAVRIHETNRKDVSCPILFTWNGERFVFVTDFLGAGSVGECEPDGGHRPPRAEESVKIEAEQLVPRDGHFVLKIAEPMNEITYLDRLQLVVLDHPADVRVYPDERFDSGGPPPTQELLAFRDEVFPVKATDHRGRDVTATLRQWDRDTVNGFAKRTWIGFAEEHAVSLDFGDRLAKFGPKDRLFLCLAGWTDYAYPESIWAAHQAGVEMMPPVLERRTADGQWEKVADAGFPAGLPRLITLDVTGKLGGPNCELRLRTNLHVFWDQIFVAPVLESVRAGQGGGTVRGTELEVKDAALTARGCMKEYSPDGREPTLYDYDRLDSFPVSRLTGRMTRYGDVTELLRARDDRFVIFSPGDELSVRFDAGRLPPLPEGWKRSYVLRTWGYCKDAGPFTAHGETVGPLPFAAMSNYPYRPDEKHPDPDYDRKWNTRRVAPRR